jgi:uncharacterized membrane protein
MNVFVEFAITWFIALVAAGLASVLAPRFFTPRVRTLPYRALDIGFVILALTYVLVFGGLSILRHDSFHSGGFDLGIFDQNIWNSLHGRPFQNSIAIESPVLLGQHLSPLLIALVPLYALWADARTLLIVQTLTLTLTALPLYWFAREQAGQALALVVVAAYFLFPSLQYVNLFEFHEVALAMPLLSLALFFFLRHQHRPFLICLMLALLVKEEIGFIVAAFGVLIFLRRQRVLGLVLVMFGTVWALAALLFVIPAFRDTIHGTNYQYVDRYQYLGSNVTEIVATAVTRPGLVLEHLLVPAKIEFVLQLFVPLAFIPLVGVEIVALAFPTLGYLLLGDNPFQNSIHFQYTALLIPFLFFATVVGLRRLTRIRPATLAILILAGSLVNYYFQAAGPLARQFDPTQYALTPHVQLGHALLQQIPHDASVMADSNLVPHISDRRWVYQTSVVPDLRLKKRAPYVPAHPLAIQFDNRITLLGYTIEASLPARRGETVSLVVVWRADQAIHERYVIFMHLLDGQEHIWAQGDREPANGWFRTDRWEAGDVTPDRYWLELPAEMAVGDYAVAVGLYDPVTGVRLKTADGQDRLILTSVEVQ